MSSVEPAAAARYGVLVMAHGGNAVWNREVTETLRVLEQRYPLEIAFGMADAGSIEAAVRRLEARGVDRIGVVRVFISGESWLERTEQIVGLRDGAPPKPAPSDDAHADHHGHAMGFWKIDSDAHFALSREGLSQAAEMGVVLAERARALSENPQHEDVLILAHGPADDAENERWLHEIDRRADALRSALPFRRIQVETLREDWPGKREAAERRIRAFVSRAQAEGGRAIVLPYRVQGFGPYADVLDGLDYVADGRGLTPHPLLRYWVERQADALAVQLAGGAAADSSVGQR